MGRLFAKLKELELDDNTLVVFTSDNGPHQEGGHKADFFKSSGPLRGKKRDLYEGGIRSPTIVRWPGHVAANSQSDHISGFQDWFETFGAIAGQSVETEDGISLAPTLIPYADAQQSHAHLYWEFLEQGGKQAVLRGDWKAVRLNRTNNPNGPLELYDLSKDPGEQNNVAASNADIVSEMAAIMQREHVAQ